MLTLEMQKALVKGIRKQQATRLLKERELFRKGVNSLSRGESYNFITHNMVVVYTQELTDKDSLGTLNKEYIKATKAMTDYNLNLNLNFYSESECTCEGRDYCGEDSKQFVQITKEVYKFSTLKQVRRSVGSLVNYCIRDAKFKLVHQPNGKDTKRYLKVIEESM